MVYFSGRLPVLGGIFLLLCSCAAAPRSHLTGDEMRLGAAYGIDAKTFARLKVTPLYRFTKADVDLYLRILQAREPDLRKRVAHLARKCLGQPYEMYPLGEGDYELVDPQPLYSLEKSDCLSFCEHIYAMALSNGWSEFFRTLLRIRYEDGEIGFLSRNHYTIPDWNPNNAWLVRDITLDLIGDHAKRGWMVCKRSQFFARFGVGHDIPDQEVTFSHIGRDDVSLVVDRLEEGDFVNVIRGDQSQQWCGHTGLITRGPDGQVYFIHSSQLAGKVVEENIFLFLQKNPEILGFKFLRLRADDE